jgi:hypothetical protein
MDVAAGFTTGFSFFSAAAAQMGGIHSTCPSKVDHRSDHTAVRRGDEGGSGDSVGQSAGSCAVPIFGLWSHCGTGEEWDDDDNSMTSADAQAFKWACSRFGLGGTFTTFRQSGLTWTSTGNRREHLRCPPGLCQRSKGMRPQAKNGNGRANAEVQGSGSRGGNSGGHRKAVRRPTNDNGVNSHDQARNI